MAIVGFNFTKIIVERKSSVSGKINITNNVSNSKTIGYKSTRTELENIFPQVLNRAIERREGRYRSSEAS